MAEPPLATPYRVGMARTGAERLAAARLVGEMYRNEGYLAEEAGGEFYSLHHLLDETLVFVARAEGSDQITGTLAVVLDSPAGLPMEALYPRELDTLRARGRKVCEFCSLAINPNLGSHTTGLLLALIRAAYRCAHYALRTDDACVTLKPSHAGFYKRLLFEPFGGLDRDPRFQGAATIALCQTRERVRSFWSSKEEQARNPLMTYTSEPLERAACDALLSVRRQTLRSTHEILQAIERRPALLREATPAACAYLARTLGARSAKQRDQEGGRKEEWGQVSEGAAACAAPVSSLALY